MLSMPTKLKGNLRLTIPTRTRLKSYGAKGDTYEKILIKLMNFYDEQHKRIEEQERGSKYSSGQ